MRYKEYTVATLLVLLIFNRLVEYVALPGPLSLAYFQQADMALGGG